jgi:uridine kinase
MTRADLLDLLAARLAAVALPHPVRVAIDGVDAAGKTTLADELARPLAERGRAVIRASIDGFHRPRAERYRRGPDSAEGYFEDSIDCVALREALLLPLGPGGARQYRTRIFDFRTDTLIAEPPREAPQDAILLFDGVFLLRPELDDQWDVRIFVEANFAVTLARALERDRVLFGDAETIRLRYERRYIPGQRLYLERVRPRERARFVIGNDDPQHPVLFERDDPLDVSDTTTHPSGFTIARFAVRYPSDS